MDEWLLPMQNPALAWLGLYSHRTGMVTMTLTTQNVQDLETASLRSTATDDAAWVGGYFSYGGSNADESCTIYFAIRPGDRLGKHADTAEETQYILSGSGDLLTDDGA